MSDVYPPIVARCNKCGRNYVSAYHPPEAPATCLVIGCSGKVIRLPKPEENPANRSAKGR